MADTGTQLPHDDVIFAGISSHATASYVVPLRRLKNMSLETLHTTVIDLHNAHCFKLSDEHTATGRIWSRPNLTCDEVTADPKILRDYRPSDSTIALDISRDGHSFVSDHIPAFQPAMPGDFPLAFVVEIVDNITPIAPPKRLAPADIDHLRPTKQRKTSTSKVLPVQRIGDSRVIKTPGSRLKLPPPSEDFLSLFKVPGCLIVDGTSAIATLEDHAKTGIRHGSWGCTVHIPTNFPKLAWTTSVAEYYNLYPQVPYDDSYAHCDIHRRPDLKHFNQSCLVLILNFATIKPQADLEALYATVTHVLRRRLVSFLQSYSERFFSNDTVDIYNLEIHDALDAVLNLVQKHGLTVFLGIVEYDLLALQTWIDYILGMLPSLPPLDVIHHAKTCFLRLHTVIQAHRQGPNPTITRHYMEDMPELASSVAMTANDVEACLRLCLPSSNPGEVNDYLKTITNIAGGYCFSADAPPHCRDLFRPQDVLSFKESNEACIFSDRQHGYHAQLRVLKHLLHISSSKDRNEVELLLVQHFIEMSDPTLRYDIDVPVQQAPADHTNAAFQQYLGSTKQAVQKLMMTLGLLAFQPEDSDICEDGVSAFAIPNHALSSKLSANLREDAVMTAHLTKFDGTKRWFAGLLSNWSTRHCDTIRTIEKIPEAVLQNTVELYVNMSSGITVFGPTPDRAISEVQLIANKISDWKNFADIFVLPRTQEKGETDSEYFQDPTHLLLLLIELKSIQLYFLFIGTFGRAPNVTDLAKFRDKLLAFPEADWQALIDDLGPAKTDLTPSQFVKRKQERDAARPKYEGGNFSKWDGGASFDERVSVRDFLMEARDQYHRYSNIAEHGTDKRQSQFIDDPRVLCDDNNALKHKIQPMSIVLVGGVVPLIDDSAPIRQTTHHFSR
ncbi:hypothetical protein CPB85DRAFT_1330727 [Mucidula mucida]|nr:hypothetical protein CPB85DRAFT_1330727 [Mucidula mucida]